MLLAEKASWVMNDKFQVLIGPCKESQLYSESFSSLGDGLHMESQEWPDGDDMMKMQ